ncbi:LLM class flavin-dependent oxidoreductase [Corynebacterium sp. A21]|uniref:LLM class flavin-dependent oxidoreductase n=1 Tax=Corynebacterium sp. A21 TaxID=3457318 RepID=UPI003FD4F7F5
MPPVPTTENMVDLSSHAGYARTYREGALTLGLLFPLEAYSGSFAAMDLEEQMKLVQRAEELGFASLFVRDAPLHDPNFGDAGIVHDPWVFLSYLAARTSHIAIGTSSMVASLRHPLHMAKAAASLDRISDERFLLGLATGDRPLEFPAFQVDHEKRAGLYRETV